MPKRKKVIIPTDETNEEKPKKFKLNITPRQIFSIIVWIILIVLFVLVLFSTQIFGVTPFTTKLKDGIGDITTIFKSIETNYTKIIKAIIYCVIVYLIFKLFRMIMKFVTKKSIKSQTVVTLFDSFIKYLTFLIGLYLVLKAFGVDPKTLLAGAGVIALIIGLGAQPLIADILNGLSIVFEGEYRVGDIVVIDSFRGTVLTIGLRTTQIIDAAGNIKIINNSEIKNIINMSQSLSLAICDVQIDYEESLLKVELLLKSNLETFKQNIPLIVEGPEYLGVAELGSSGVTLRIIARCKEENKFQVQRDLNRQIKLLFDKHKVTIPFQQFTISNRKNKSNGNNHNNKNTVDNKPETKKENINKK